MILLRFSLLAIRCKYLADVGNTLGYTIFSIGYTQH